MTKRQFIDYISNPDIGQGKVPRKYLKFVQSCASPQEAWEKCPDSSFMTWYLERIEYDDVDALLRIALRFVREVKLQDDGRTVWDSLTDERSRSGVKTAERFLDGEVTPSELSEAEHLADLALRDADDTSILAMETGTFNTSIQNARTGAFIVRTILIASMNYFHDFGAVAARAVIASFAEHAADTAQQADIIRELIPEIPPIPKS